MRKTVLRLFAVLILVALPFGIHWGYQQLTALPKSIVIATGPVGGRYRVIGEQLAEELEEEFKIRVEVRETAGSLENISMLENGDVDLALYQPGTRAILGKEKDSPAHQASFVANVYSEVVQFIVRRDAGIDAPKDLIGKRVALGLKDSGDYAISRVLLEHFGLDEEIIEPHYGSYRQIREGFINGTLDAAIVTAGIRAPIYSELFKTGKCVLFSLPHADALAMKNVSIFRYDIPAGFYHLQPTAEPATDIQTVSMRAQLLCRDDSPEQLVNAVTRVLLDEEFMRMNRLAELFQEGTAFARAKPEFAIHPGARDVYEPGLHPILDSEFVEATEGMRSFIVSVLIAAYLVFRWLRERRKRQNEHQLDGYIRSLLDIEKRQMSLDYETDRNGGDTLQGLLDEVTLLRQEALREFSAHDLKEDRATDCFLEMCHSVSDKINAKLSRILLNRKLGQLIETVKNTEESSDS